LCTHALGDLRQTVGVPVDESQGAAAAGQGVGELLADASGRSGDDRGPRGEAVAPLPMTTTRLPA
jgi:hypothetical protein